MKDKKQKAKEMLGLDGRRKRRKEDWSQYDAAMLEKKLIDRQVIQQTNDVDSERLVYSQAMIDLAEKCVKDQQVHGEESTSGPAESDEDVQGTFSPAAEGEMKL